MHISNAVHNPEELSLVTLRENAWVFLGAVSWFNPSQQLNPMQLLSYSPLVEWGRTERVKLRELVV